MHIRLVYAAAVSILVLLLSACSAGRSSFNKAERLELDGRLDEAAMKYAEAASKNPEVGEYRLRFLAVSEKAARKHLKTGEALMADARYDEAYQEFQSAIALDSSLITAQQFAEKALKLRDATLFYVEGLTFEKENKPKDAIRSYRRAAELDPKNEEFKKAIARIEKNKKSKMDGYELQIKSAKPITLKFKDAKLKEVFQILSQLSGINFVFDEAVKEQNVSIMLENANFQQALDILTGMFKLGKKALNESTVVVYPRTPDKIKQYEELFIQTFYLNKLDAKKAVNLIRTMLQVKKIYVNEELNALVIRDNPELIEVAGKILEANDVPDPEVLLEVEVMELSKKNLQDFGLALSRYAVQMGATTPQNQFFSDTLSTAAAATTSTTTGTTTTGTTSTGTSVSNLLNVFSYRGYNGFLTVPNATFNFGKTLSNGETLSNPKIRVKNREKAKFNVGQRVPITTTSSNGTVGGVNVNVQYVDVGVKMNAEPVIHINNEVNIKLSLEVSSILRIDKIGTDGNTQVATIGTRNLDTVLTLKDGETSIIGGLLQNLSNDNTQKVFLLGDIPVLGTLFSNNHKEGEKTELLLAITPRIVRGTTLPAGDASAFWTGLEDDPTVTRAYNSFQQEVEVKESAPPAHAAQPVPPVSTRQQPGTPPAQLEPPLKKSEVPPVQPVATEKPLQPTSPATPAPPSGETPLTPVPLTPLPAEPSAQEEQATKLRVVAPKTVEAESQLTADIMIVEAKDLVSAPFTLVYDPLFFDFLSAVEGEFLKQDGKQVLFRVTNDAKTGRVTVGMTRVGDVGGVNGSGKLLSALFRAKKKGPASFGIMGAGFRAVKGKPVEVIPYNSVVDVQ